MGFEAFFQALKDRRFPLDFPGHFIGGEWCLDSKSEVLQGSFNPSTGEPIVKVLVSKKLLEAAVDSADQVQKELAALPMEKRLEYLARLRQVITDYRSMLVEALCVEAGKPRWEAQADFHSACQQLDAVLAESSRIQDALLGPVKLAWPDTEFNLQANGIAIAFLPFSTPLATFVQTFAAAMIAGAPLLAMPSSHAVMSGVLFGCIINQLELPRGAVNIVFGNYQTFVKMLQDKRVQAIIYSGSREHCDSIRRDNVGQISRLLLLQSGGKNAAIIDSEASVQEAVRCVMYGVIKNAGQLNTSTSRVYVHESILENFKKEMIRVVRALRIGPTDGADDPHLGPLYAQKAVDKFLRYQTMAKREASDTWVWGKVRNTGTNGYFVTPGVHFFEDLDSSSSYQSNVLMCPDLAVYAFKEIEQAFHAANNTDAALVTSLIGPVAKIKPWVSQLRAPNVLLNLPTVGTDVNLPVAGRKLCGDYRLNGLGIAYLLAYPQACQASSRELNEFAAWPVLD
jgi:acyl-CoA reductase-like NAD-dependent aldehyde dehydrogenase